MTPVGHIAICRDGVRGSVESIIATRERTTWEIRQADGTPRIVDVEEVLSFHHPDNPPCEDWNELADALPNEQAGWDADEDAAIAAEGTR
ncbi:MAG: hypothetical protein ABFE08_19905 [Armatimonadia bacterium]